MLQYVGIHESSGYLHKSHWCKSQRIFTQVQFVTKFCSGRRLVMLQEFTKVVDVYKKQWTFNIIPIGHVPHVNTHMNTNTAPKTWGMPTRLIIKA